MNDDTFAARDLKCSGMMNLLFLTCRACEHEDSVVLPKVQVMLSCTSCGAPFSGVRSETLNGFVYILSNRSMPGLLKIGMTANDVVQRAAELSASTGVPEPYVVEAYTACQDPKQTEAALHALFEPKRKPSREFFEVQLGEAVVALRKEAGRLPDFLSETARTHFSVAPTMPVLNEDKGRVAPTMPALNEDRGRPRVKKNWERSFIKVRADCPRCGRSYSVDYRAASSACESCGAPLSFT